MGFAATLQTTFQPKTNLQQHCKLLFSQKQTCSSTANYFSAKKQTCSSTANYFSSQNKLAATLQTTFQLKTGLQQRCKSHVNGKQHLFFP